MLVGWRARALLPLLMYTTLLAAVVGSLGAPLVPTLAREQHVSLGTAQWALTVTLMVGSVATPVFGRLADGRRRRRWIVTALSVICAGAALSAIAPSFGVLLAGRALQGVSYGILAMALASIREHTPPGLLQSRVATLSITGATGLGVGYPLVAAITQYLGYREAFWFAVLFVLPAIPLLLAVLPRQTAPIGDGSGGLDVGGALLLGGGLLAMLIVVSEGAAWGWTSTPVLILAAAAAAIGVGWVAHELRHPRPLVQLRLLRHRSVLVANVSAFSLGIVMFMGFSLITRLAQTPSSVSYGLGASLLVGGFVLSPLALGSQVSNRLARAAGRRYGMAAVLPAGAVVAAIPNLGLAVIHQHVWQMALAMLLFGAGVGSTFAAMPALIMEGAPPGETGSATSFNQVLRTVGGAVGSCLSAVILGAWTVAGGTYPAETGYTLAFALSGGGCLAVAAGLLLFARRQRSATHVLTDPTSALTPLPSFPRYIRLIPNRRDGTRLRTLASEREPVAAGRATGEQTMKPYRSLLITSGDDAAAIERAIQSEADAFVFDLEDLVLDANKARARVRISKTIRRLRDDGDERPILVRVNDLDSGFAGLDIAGVVQPGLDGLMLTKTRNRDDIVGIAALVAEAERANGVPVGTLKFLVPGETAEALEKCLEIVSHERVFSMIGAATRGDVAHTIGYEWQPDGTETLYYRSRILLASRAAGIEHPTSGCWETEDDIDGLVADVTAARRLGYRGYLTIYPHHTPHVNRALTPSDEELARYRAMIDGFDKSVAAGESVFTFEGRFTDLAHIKTARHRLEQAEALSA